MRRRANVDPFTGREPVALTTGQLVLPDGQLCLPDLGASAAEVEARLRQAEARHQAEMASLRSVLEDVQRELETYRERDRKRRAASTRTARETLLAWRAYHRANPAVWYAVAGIVDSYRVEGRRHLTIRLVWEDIRNNRRIPVSLRPREAWKLPDHYTPLYVRLLIQARPELEEMFTRKASCRFEGLDLVAFLRGDDTVLERLEETDERETDGEAA